MAEFESDDFLELSSTGANVAVVHCCFFRLSSSSFFLAISASCLCFNLSLIEAKVGSILTGPGSAFLGFHSSKLIFDSTSIEFLFSISRSLSSSSLLRFSEFLFSRSDLPDPRDLSDCFDLDLFDLERDLDLDFLDFDGDLLDLATGRDCDLDLDLDLDLDFDILLDPRSLDLDLDFDLLETDSDSDLRVMLLFLGPESERDLVDRLRTRVRDLDLDLDVEEEEEDVGSPLLKPRGFDISASIIRALILRC